MFSLNLHKKLFDFLTFADIITIVRSDSQRELLTEIKILRIRRGKVICESLNEDEIKGGVAR